MILIRWLKNHFRSDDNFPRVVAFAALAISGLPLLAVAIYQNERDPVSMNNQIHLEREFRAIKDLPLAKELNYESHQKRGLAYVSGTYETNLDIVQASSYYDDQLVANGWRAYDQEQGVRSYCKGKYKVTLGCTQHVSQSRCEIVFTWGFESITEKYITGDKYRSRGCSD